MIKAVFGALCASVLSVGLALAGTAEDGKATYDLLFRNGTLDDVDRTAALVYRRDVINALKPDAAKRDTGDIALFFEPERAGMARLELRQDEKYRSLGIFPASVGNPMIMFFYETVIRDMAEAAGGSPFYIRNRVKEALVQPWDVTVGEAVYNGATIETQTVRMLPFADDPNVEKMRGFGNLELVVTMSEDVPGWYLSLEAEAGEKSAPVYRSGVALKGLEAGE